MFVCFNLSNKDKNWLWEVTVYTWIYLIAEGKKVYREKYEFSWQMLRKYGTGIVYPNTYTLGPS